MKACCNRATLSTTKCQDVAVPIRGRMTALGLPLSGLDTQLRLCWSWCVLFGPGELRRGRSRGGLAREAAACLVCGGGPAPSRQRWRRVVSRHLASASVRPALYSRVARVKTRHCARSDLGGYHTDLLTSCHRFANLARLTAQASLVPRPRPGGRRRGGSRTGARWPSGVRPSRCSRHASRPDA